MKNKTGMTKLRNKIVWSFIIVVFAVRVLDSVIDSTWDEMIAPKLYPGGDYAGIVDAGTICYVGASLVLYIISAIVFYYMVKKIVEKESLKQVQEQNFIYAAIAHDLKTPMTSVQGFAAALRDGKIKADEQGEICDIIYLKTRHMNELIDTLSAYSKIGTGEYSLNTEKVNLCALVRDVAAMNYSDFENKDIEMVIDIPEEPVFFNLDKKEFTRAINNIVVNACKHNSSGCQVLVKVHTDNQRTFITVADTGEIIPDNLVPTIFDPFVCGNTSRTSGNGSGLGLAVSARIAEISGIELYYSTEIEGYSKGFIFELDR